MLFDSTTGKPIPPVRNVTRIEIREKHEKAIGIVLHCKEPIPETLYALRGQHWPYALSAYSYLQSWVNIQLSRRVVTPSTDSVDYLFVTFILYLHLKPQVQGSGDKLLSSSIKSTCNVSLLPSTPLTISAIWSIVSSGRLLCLPANSTAYLSVCFGLI